MKHAAELSQQDLKAVVSGIQAILYGDIDVSKQGQPGTGANIAEKKRFWNPDKTWQGADTLQEIANLLADHDLVPEGGDYL